MEGLIKANRTIGSKGLGDKGILKDFININLKE